jgi:hypothetical protein
MNETVLQIRKLSLSPFVYYLFGFDANLILILGKKHIGEL